MTTALIVLLVAALLGRWVIAGMNRGNTPELAATYQAEVARLREEMDQLQAEVVRLADEQSFMVRLLGPARSGADPVEGADAESPHRPAPPEAPGAPNQETP